MPKQNPPVSFRDVNIEVQLDARGSARGITASRDLGRYYHALREELRAVELSESEAMLIIDACNGTLFEPHTIRLLWAQIDDAIVIDKLAGKWEIDGPALVAKLRALSYTQSLAVVDAAERYWQGADSGTEQPTPQSVGLVR